PLWTQEALIAAQNSRPTHPGMSSYQREEPGGFWVSIEEAVSAFVEVGVCMVPLPPRKAGDCREQEKILGGSGWAQERPQRNRSECASGVCYRDVGVTVMRVR
ncbi:unnamed protein product, partial [Ectocarpus sp. 13 AM-2016]